MVIFAVMFAILFSGIKKKTGNSYFIQNLHLLSFLTIYSLPWFPLKWRAYEFFPEDTGGHPRTSGVTLKGRQSFLFQRYERCFVR